MALDVAPPGHEKQVRELKQQPGVENAYAVAWASYNKAGDCVDQDANKLDGGEHADVIKQQGGRWVLVAKSTGKVLGAHATKAGAEEQERAMQASKHADGGRRVRRLDRGTLAPAERLGNGWLRVEGRSARTGILEYDNPDGTLRRELVLPEDLFDKDSLDSARMVPVVNTHPPVGLLDAATAKIHQVGSVGENFRADGDYLVAPLLITDGATVQAVESGRSELSWGYDCQLDPPDPALAAKWGNHDGIQRARKYNHLAVVDKARAGDDARIRLDGEGHAELKFAISAALQHSDAALHKTENATMPTSLRIDGVSISSDAPDLQLVIDRVLAQVRADGEKAVKTEKERADGIAAAIAHVKANALQRGKLVRGLVERIDAMKARMVGCDECGGEGKVMDDAGASAKCDYCDGKGSVRMHDAIKAMPGAAQDDDEEEAPAAKMVDDDDLERDDPEEEKVEKAANSEHRDEAKRRADERKAAQKRRADSIARMVARVARQRAALVIEAQKHLDAEEKLDGKTDAEIKRAVVAKLAPHLDAAKLSDAEVALLYKSEVARIGKERQDGALTATDRLRAGLTPIPRGNSQHNIDLQKRIDEANRAKYHSHERPAAK